ncbi:ABC transporter ATP-binding protein [Adlercreutzia sp. ZJ138]|uniref:ABC transporter ATP-binding protein n=1 Tax=Adlercreutzia sp. ZJ138 TaxID=2709405 RepID=UPI0013ED3BC0|nr:ABC transporter ATP-binding protein [Adlercreutzia sp. ZJ138]
MADIVHVEGLTKDYGHNRGVFDLTFSVAPGEVLGFLGANGAGKTVTLRTLMGFIRADQGCARIAGLDCFAHRDRIQRTLGYLPGELALPPHMTADAFLRFQAQVRELHDLGRIQRLIEFFELDSSMRIGSMSKGNKQKVGIVCAFFHTPDVLLLDEPTTGLDLLMQRRFVELVQAERARGATVLMSSHLLGEVERLCDRVLFIRHGRRIMECKPAELTMDGALVNLYGEDALAGTWHDAS